MYKKNSNDNLKKHLPAAPKPFLMATQSTRYSHSSKGLSKQPSTQLNLPTWGQVFHDLPQIHIVICPLAHFFSFFLEDSEMD